MAKPTPISKPVLGPVKPIPPSKVILGTEGGDILYGTGTATAMDGGNGDDVLLGWGVKYDRTTRTAIEDATKSRNETLHGGRGKDSLYGGAGDDSLNGGADDDVLVGGTGKDTFMLSAGNDLIKDFDTGGNVLIDFEGLPAGRVPGGYAGLTWNASANVAESNSGSGYGTVLTSGILVAYDAYAVGTGFSNPNADFDFKSGNFAPAWNNNLIVTVNAYDDGLVVGTATLKMDWNVKSFVDFAHGSFTGADSGIFTGRFTSIDAITIDGVGGTDAGLGGGGTHVAIDDLKIRYGGGDMEMIDVADGTNIASLIRSATSDGHGGTILTHSTGTLALVGVDPSDVSAAWFV